MREVPSNIQLSHINTMTSDTINYDINEILLKALSCIMLVVVVLLIGIVHARLRGEAG